MWKLFLGLKYPHEYKSMLDREKTKCHNYFFQLLLKLNPDRFY